MPVDFVASFHKHLSPVLVLEELLHGFGESLDFACLSLKLNEQLALLAFLSAQVLAHDFVLADPDDAFE